MAGVEATTIHRSLQPDLIPGYRLESLLGRGGMGEVHKATQLSLNRTVAVKILATELAKDPTFVARFEKEAAALATLSHPNVIDIVEKGHIRDTWYLVMEYIDGPSLREVMRSPLLEPSAVLRMVYEICRGIDYAHSRGVIHRDLKPENILFDEQAGGIPKVTDFGLASFVERADKTERFNVTETHVAMGTLSYMAPEQRLDARTADHRADIYSLGVILYEVLVGEVPVGSFAPPSKRRPGVDERVDEIVGRCLKQNPGDRYQRVSEILADMEPLVPVSMTSLHRRAGPTSRFVSRLKRAARTTLRAVSIALVLGAVAVLAIGYARAGTVSAERYAGAAVAGDLDPHEVLTVPGRVDKDGPRRHLMIGDGPDTIPLLAFGRPATVDGEALLSAAELRNPAARIEPDVIDLEGVSVSVNADASAERADRGLSGFVRRMIYGEAPAGRATVMLLGTTGRYASVSLSSAGDSVAFEYALGERRGVMLAGASPESGRAPLSVVVDEEGALRAFIGEGGDRRAVGEPVYLGREWRKHFGGEVRPAFGCLDGTCSFRRVRQQVTAPQPVAQAPTTTEPPVVAQVAPPAPPPQKPAAPKKSVTTKRPAYSKKATSRKTRRR
jgi:eukaryotic-like serine/threonine-protein kinase